MPAKTTTDLPVRYLDAAAIPAINDFAPGQRLAIYSDGCRKPWTGEVVETSCLFFLTAAARPGIIGEP